MANATTAPTGGILTGGKVLLILIAFFGLDIGVNALLAYDAVSTFRGEVSDNPYEAGLAYNNQIAAADAQSERHWKVDVTLAGGGVRAIFHDAQGQPIEGLVVSGIFAAPADMARDRPFAMRATGGGAYVGGGSPPAGVWDLKLKATRDGATLFQSINRVTLR
jgi:nitrogen fixation protein FixH